MTEEQFQQMYAEYISALDMVNPVEEGDINYTEGHYLYKNALGYVSHIAYKLFAEISASHGYRMEIEHAD